MAAKLMTVKELAAYLDVPVPTIYEWNYREIGPRYVRCGRHLRYRPNDVETWLDAGGTKAATETQRRRLRAVSP